MKSFKKWILSELTVSMMTMGGPEVEYDEFEPDENHVLSCLKLSGTYKGFFRTFRAKIKDYMLLKAFEEATESFKGMHPFAPNNQLQHNFQQYIAARIGLPLQQIEPYCDRLMVYFRKIAGEHNNTKTWDYADQPRL